MKKLFENEYMEIRSNTMPGVLEIKSKKVCDDINELEKHIIIINQYVKDTKAKKLIFTLDTLEEISKESLLNEKLFPFIGGEGIQDIAVVTGGNKKVKTLVHELGSYVSPLKRQYHIRTEVFDNYEPAIDWINAL
ncbi:MAG TPA: hypothetical protein VKP59_04360 [Candidatus Thermoplasmatota archaeon]|nr:hypothetical protein [Candidatus Thermoplasmatota archaeon]